MITKRIVKHDKNISLPEVKDLIGQALFLYDCRFESGISISFNTLASDTEEKSHCILTIESNKPFHVKAFEETIECCLVQNPIPEKPL